MAGRGILDVRLKAGSFTVNVVPDSRPASFGFTFDLNVPPKLLDNAVTHVQPQTCPFPHFFCREEWLEYFVYCF